MFKKIIKFIKYNNATVLILIAIFIAGTGAFAQTEAGQAFIGEQATRVEGVDNTLLIDIDLDNFDMDYKIERVEGDDRYYYIIYTFLDLVKRNNAWQYQLNEKKRKVSQKLKKDLGEYLAEELGEEYEARIKELKEKQASAWAAGEETRVEITEYSGLIGKTLETAGRIFSGYEPVTRQEVPSPPLLSSLLTIYSPAGAGEEENPSAGADDLTDIYNQYLAENDPDGDDIFGSLDNCPDIANPEQADADEDGIGDACDLIDLSTSFGSPSTNSGRVVQDGSSGQTQQTTDDSEQTADKSTGDGAVDNSGGDTSDDSGTATSSVDTPDDSGGNNFGAAINSDDTSGDTSPDTVSEIDTETVVGEIE